MFIQLYSILNDCSRYYDQQSVKNCKPVWIRQIHLQGIIKFVEMIGEKILDHKPQARCFLVNSVLEISPGKAAINQEATKHLGAIESRLFSALVLAHEAGELPAKKDPKVLAKDLMINLWGLQVLIQIKRVSGQYWIRFLQACRPDRPQWADKSPLVKLKFHRLT